MYSSFFVAWCQLSHHKTKLAAASAGVVVAVMLMLVQLGIRQGAMDNSIAFTKRITSDLVLLSPRSRTMFQSAQFPRRLLYRLPSIEAVEKVEEIYIGSARWRNPWQFNEHPISVYGIEPDSTLIRLPGYAERSSQLRLSDRVLFDRKNRKSYGPVAECLGSGAEIEVEINGRKVRVVGMIDVGVSIANDGNLYTSPNNFRRMIPSRTAGAIDCGLVKLRAGCDIELVRDQVQQLVGQEVRVLTRQELLDAEIAFMREAAPVDFIFGMGAMVGFFIGFVVVYQILYTEVSNHLPQLATLKAIGFTDFYLLKLVLSQSLVLSVIGYVPGFFLAIGLYEIATSQIQMPFSMTLNRAVGVFVATIVMCSLSATIAVRKAWTADPAGVF